MNERKIIRLFPNASRSFIEANSKLQPAEPCEHEATLEQAPEGKEEGMARVIVRFTFFRVRLLDPDNSPASGKDLLDGLRHAHCFRDDSERYIDFSTSQVQVGSREEEGTDITIIWP